MAEIVGIERADFTSRDNGKRVEGSRFYLATPIAEDRGTGVKVEAVYFTKERLADLSFAPGVGDFVDVFYSRQGRAVSMVLLSRASDIEII